MQILEKFKFASMHLSLLVFYSLDIVTALAKFGKVFDSFGYCITVEAKNDATSKFTIDVYIDECLLSYWCQRHCFSDSSGYA